MLLSQNKYFFKFFTPLVYIFFSFLVIKNTNANLNANSNFKIHSHEQHNLPIIDVAIDFKQSPQFYEPALAELTAVLLNKGSKNRSESELAQQLADLGIELSINQDEERVKIRMRTLTKHWNQAVELLGGILQEPLFLEDVVLREKNRLLSNWRETQKEPEAVLETAQNPIIFGNITENSRFPINQMLTEKSIQSVSSAALKNYYQQNYCAPEVVLMGDIAVIHQHEILQTLTNSFKFCKQKNTENIENITWNWDNIPLKSKKQEPQIIKHHATQSHIRVMQVAVSRTHDDYFPLLVANHILGGNGFNSRLMKEVRENRGLTYGIQSMLQPYKDGGLFQIYLRTAKKNTLQALKITLDTWKNLASGTDLKATEIDFAKKQLIASFPLKLDTQKKKLEQLSSQYFYQLPENYLEQWQSKVEKVTQQQVLSVMKKYWLEQPYHIAYLID